MNLIVLQDTDTFISAEGSAPKLAADVVEDWKEGLIAMLMVAPLGESPECTLRCLSGLAQHSRLSASAVKHC